MSSTFLCLSTATLLPSTTSPPQLPSTTSSYDDFYKEFDLCCKETYQIFAKKKSEYREDDEEQYKYQVWECIRHEPPNSSKVLEVKM